MQFSDHMSYRRIMCNKCTFIPIIRLNLTGPSAQKDIDTGLYPPNQVPLPSSSNPKRLQDTRQVQSDGVAALVETGPVFNESDYEPGNGRGGPIQCVRKWKSSSMIR